ncbi:porin family protein [Cytophaga aurantiaca]|uniref:porin family protein n=1 Tax=Cytophaga aurantiaca TaxID=29530 RepID=UPI00037F5AB6|nr:porin family protein [Cytophaga aurantiaca]
MKKSIVFIFLLFSISAFSQQNKWYVGIVGGAGVTKIRTNFSYKPNPNIGFYTGLSGQYNFSKHFAIHTELAFDRKGTKDNFTFSDINGNIIGPGKAINQLNYLTLPMLFRASIGNKVTYFLQAGPYLSYLLNQTSKYSSNIDDPQYNFKINGTSYISRMDFGMSAGLGAVIPVKEKFSVSCELRGNYGLIKLSNNNSATIKSYNESLNFLVGISYKIG